MFQKLTGLYGWFSQVLFDLSERFLPGRGLIFRAEVITLDLSTAIKAASERNLERKCKRRAGNSRREIIRANCFSNHNPKLDGDIRRRSELKLKVSEKPRLASPDRNGGSCHDL
jgi:hypothetical protein